MLYTLSRTFPLRIVILALMSASLCALLWSGQVAWASEANLVGRVGAMPAGSLIGTWVVQGVSFVTTNSTEFRQDKGAFAVGGCVEVEYVGAVQPFAATKIASKNSDDCSVSGTPTGAPSVTTTPGFVSGTLTITADGAPVVLGTVTVVGKLPLPRMGGVIVCRTIPLALVPERIEIG